MENSGCYNVMICIQQHSNGQVMHHQVQPYSGTANLAATYHPSMVYPVMNAAPHQQMTRHQHYYPSANLVHQLNNSQVMNFSKLYHGRAV